MDRDVLSLIKAPAGAFSIAPIDNPGLAPREGLGIMAPRQRVRWPARQAPGHSAQEMR